MLESGHDERHVRPRLRELGLVVGRLPTGPRNAISDVVGVAVGHHTLYCPEMGICTGVTAVRPHPGNVFREKVRAAAHVINGFGKTTGLAQIAELGTLETPIILTSTLSVGTAAHGLVRWMLALDAEIGDTAGTVNPVVMECSDAYLNDQRALAVQPEHVWLALDNARAKTDAEDGRPEEGAVGAGAGFICYGYKGGIGTASRRVAGPAGTFIVGVLVLANFGRREELRFPGRPRFASSERNAAAGGETVHGDGSVVVVAATDAPLSSRQLGRLARRAVVGLSRTGSNIGHGSGEFVLAFSTADRIPHHGPDVVMSVRQLPDHGETFAHLMVAVAEATEESVYNALLRAHTTRGFRGRVAEAIPLA